MVLDALDIRYKTTDKSLEMVQLVSHSPCSISSELPKIWNGARYFVCSLEARETGMLYQSFVFTESVSTCLAMGIVLLGKMQLNAALRKS